MAKTFSELKKGDVLVKIDSFIQDGFKPHIHKYKFINVEDSLFSYDFVNIRCMHEEGTIMWFRVSKEKWYDNNYHSLFVSNDDDEIRKFAISYMTHNYVGINKYRRYRWKRRLN